MKVSLNWLREYVDIDLPPAELARRLTDATAEVEGFETIGAQWSPEAIIVGQVLRVEPHPNADRLRLATVDTGSGEATVVCGAPNVAAGQKIAFAREGAELIDGHTGKLAKLKLRPIRGVESAGMVLSEKELGLSEEHEGILVLPDEATVGRPLGEQIGDVIFDITTWANRADLLGVHGMAREVAAFTGRELRPLALEHGESERDAGSFVDVSIEAPDLCRRFTATVIENVTVAPSPPWLQERLRKAGQRPINNVVDITNYVMLETGQPLHAFDYDKVRGKRIVARRARQGERLTTLDGVDRELDPDILMICDGEGPVGVAGIMGGGDSEVSESTRNVLLEVANFHPSAIRKASMLLKLRSEASLRFEKGLGPEMPALVQRRALRLFEQVTGGTVARGMVDVYPRPLAAAEIALTTARVEQVLGMVIPPAEIERILGALGFDVKAGGEGEYLVRPPFWRTDIEIPDDIVEELGRIHGYDKLPTTFLRGQLPDEFEAPVVGVRERARDLMVALGFQEIITYTLSDMETMERTLAPGDTRRRTPLGMVNPVGAQYRYLRTSLRSSLLRTYAHNRPRHDGALRLFEAGLEYLPREEDLPHERPVLCAVLGGPREQRWAVGEDAEPLDFFDAKGAVEALLQGVRVEGQFAAADEFGLLGGHTAVVSAGKRHLGVLGQVHPDLARSFDIDEPVFLLEIGLEELAAVAAERPAYAPASRYPGLRQDLALLVDEAVPAAEVVGRIRNTRLVAAADVFDEYRGGGVPEGKKSLAVSVLYQAPDRTLSDKDVERTRAGLLKFLEREVGATLRT